MKALRGLLPVSRLGSVSAAPPGAVLSQRPSPAFRRWSATGVRFGASARGVTPTREGEARDDGRGPGEGK